MNRVEVNLQGLLILSFDPISHQIYCFNGEVYLSNDGETLYNRFSTSTIHFYCPIYEGCKTWASPFHEFQERSIQIYLESHSLTHPSFSK